MATTSELSVLGPIDPASRPTLDEEEKAAPWIVRKLVGVSVDSVSSVPKPNLVNLVRTDLRHP